MADQVERRPGPRSRGKGFPILSLPDAIAALQEAGKYGFEHPKTALAEYLGHGSAASGPFRRKLAALRDWGVVVVEGETVRFTDLGKRLAMPEPEREAADREEAFRNAELFAAVYDNSAKGRDLDPDSLGNNAVLRLGVGVASKGLFTKSFTSSVIAAGLGEDAGNGMLRLVEAGRGGEPAPVRTDDPDPQPPSADRVFGQTWQLPGGGVELNVTLDRPLPLAAYEHLRGVASAVQDLANSLNEGALDDSGTRSTSSETKEK